MLLLLLLLLFFLAQDVLVKFEEQSVRFETLLEALWILLHGFGTFWEGLGRRLETP